MSRQCVSPAYRRFLKEAKIMQVMPVVASVDIKEEKRIYVPEVTPRDTGASRMLTLVAVKPPKTREYKGKYKNPLRFSLPPGLQKVEGFFSKKPNPLL